MQIYDIAVVGAGPAGSVAAMSAAKNGARVCLFERKETVGIPVRCGEGIGKRSLMDHIEAKQSWIKNTTRKTIMVSPSGIRVEVGGDTESYILDREKMDFDLVQGAISAGVEFYPSTSIVSIKKVSQGYECISSQKTFQAKLVIIADGVESRLAKDLGWNTTLSLEDIETSAFARVVSPFIDKESCMFFTGTGVAPGGYAWIFPKG
ncbi:MAG: NAD(P)/FAD-dependent oxidoreductase, partial [Fibrobacter sp.]|nr:NAD(P)/FAD-dependent oxidoreductase [Fibrobacter sp.]